MKKQVIIFGSTIVLISSLFLIKACILEKNDHSNKDNSSSNNEAAALPIDNANSNLFAHFPEPVPEKIIDITNERISNLEAPVPPQCYTKTEQTNNPCYVCHQVYPTGKNTPYRMNKLNDGSLQGGYAFSDIGVSNHWQNLFEDKSAWVDAISDETILQYINHENYSALPTKLKESNWQGFIPDLANYQLAAAAFGNYGIAKDGSAWVAFNYKPFPSTFWPTNGSTDDVVIRLPEKFRTMDGHYSQLTYLLNLSVAEMTIKDLNQIDIPETDETLFMRDINGDSNISGNVTTLIKQTHYFGDASDHVVLPQQYPLGTEFMHSVRYVGVTVDNTIVVPPRMKELRYMTKIRELTDNELDNRYWKERKEKFEEELPSFINHNDKGFENGLGWLVQGFIENNDGELRAQSYEEGMFCMGCHAAIGTTIDQTFAFGRKVTGVKGWQYIDLNGMQDAPSIASDTPEILEYLQKVNGGNEFRENNEIKQKWFNTDGSIKEELVRNADVYTLITPSRDRALMLNKAYTHIVRHQDYIYGRDANTLPFNNVFTDIDESEPPLDAEHLLYGWDSRLHWQ